MIRNFLFHRVSPQRDELWDPMDVALFDKCISYITKRYNVRLLEDLIDSPELKTGEQLATISFDDGYKDNIEYAAPILDMYNCKASFYVVTDSIDRNIPTWTHILEHRFQETKLSDLDLRFDFLPAELQVTTLSTRSARLEYVRRLKPFLKKISHENRAIVCKKVDDSFADCDLPRIMMDWQDLLKLQKSGHYIGSHTVSHCMLGTMTDETEIRNELLRSGEIIENKLGKFPKSISYPVGSYNETTIRISKEVGYSMGLAVKQKLYDPRKESIFEIPRIELYNENWMKTKWRITNFLEDIKKVIRFKR